jgi:uncharacterized protein YbaR (Trm112 family)/SAM-dependent methyltransferase
MKKEILKVLAYPVYKGFLSLNAAQEFDNEILGGSLICSKCDKTYYIEEDIPDISPKVPIQAKIGLNRWHKVQAVEERYQGGKCPKLEGFDTFEKCFNVSRDLFRDKICLEMGCGITEPIHYSNEAKMQIGLDPLCSRSQELYFSENTHRVPHITGVGEYLPIKSDIIDAIFIFGVLDHCLSPEVVLKEASRVLIKGGNLYISLYTFSIFLRLLGAI